MKELFENETIRALGWYQPFASLMFHGKIETRTYPTKVRGKVLIYACQGKYKLIMLLAIVGATILKKICEVLGFASSDSFTKLPRGCAIGIANLTDCRPMTPSDEDKCFVKYRQELWCWIFEDVQEIEPFPFKGKQGWSVLSDDMKSKIKIKINTCIPIHLEN